MQDRYSRKRLPLQFKSIVLENKYLRAEFLPQLGGRLYSLFDKENNTELVFKNPVIQPANLAIRNAWLSGGIEWNIGSFGHTFTTCDNVFAAKLSDNKGNEFLRIYEFERLTSVFWQVDFHLPDTSRELIVHVKIINSFCEPTTTYWWSNVAVPNSEKTRILSSDENIISFVGNNLKYEKLPYITAMPDVDVTYPLNASRAFDFFIQPENNKKCTWEAAVYQGGITLFERSTPPLSYKKLFSWGNHNAGKHWQDFLSDKNCGDYAEIQAGIAPSQLHDKMLGGGEVLEWTQCFGGIKGDAQKLYDTNFSNACSYLGSLIDLRLSEADLTDLDSELRSLARLPVTEDMLLHTASGFGAVEAMRMQKDGDGVPPQSQCYPHSTVGAAEQIWEQLLQKGNFPVQPVRGFVPTYNVSPKWKKHIESAEDNWYSLMQKGILAYEEVDHTKFAADAVSEQTENEKTERAQELWLKAIEHQPNYMCYRNLAVLETQRNCLAAAEEYYEKALNCSGAYDDHSLVSEYLALLARAQKYNKLWETYKALPKNCKEIDRIDISVAVAAVKLDQNEFLEDFFTREHYDIKEGESSLTDIWFEFCAKKLAKERGITQLTQPVLDELIDEAWDKFPPSENIDFRTSVSRKQKYRDI